MKRTFLTNVKREKVSKELEVFATDNAVNIRGERLPNSLALHTKPTRKARLLVMTCLSPKTWLDMFLAGSKKKNQK